MSRFLFLLCCILCVCCTESPRKTVAATPIQVDKKQEPNSIDSTVLDSTALGIRFKPKGNYNQIKASLAQDRTYFLRLFRQDKNKAIDSCSKYLYSKLLNDIIPHWYGTVWDFNGHANIPNDGVIACGYFVSTTLKHLGFKLNRYKMAQQAGMNEAISLQAKNQLKIYRNVSYKKLKSKLNSAYKDGLYFVGLSNHVGYVLIKDKELYFIHSSYCDNVVVVEKAEYSPCFVSDIYVFAEITSNRKLIQKWIQDTYIPVHS